MRRIHLLPIAVMLTVSLGLTGCLERKEKIKVAADGSAEIAATMKGDPSDLTTGDSMPTVQTGWRVNDSFETDKDGKKTQTREAVIRVAAGGEWPASYAAAGTEDAEVGLKFPTGLTIETRADGTYYHFHRVYRAREEAKFEYVREAMKDQLDKLSGVEPENMTQEQRETLVDALRQFEAAKQMEFVVTAARTMNDWPQDRVLKVRQAIADYFNRIDIAPVVRKLSEPASDARDGAIQEFADGMIGDVKTALVNEMQSWGISTGEQEQMLAAYERESRRRAVTEDIGDDHFEIAIEMPGEIIAHNGTRAEDGAVTWEFPGKALMDRDQEIMVSSRVTSRGK